jgi:hypothetical protein
MAKPSGNPRGRPPKSAIAEIKEKRSVGRPKGTSAIIAEYRDRMLASPKSAKVLEKVFEVALTDGHPGQMAAMKLVLDRVVPQSAFDTAKTSGATPSISINISSFGQPTVETVQQDFTDVEVKEYTDDE